MKQLIGNDLPSSKISLAPAAIKTRLIFRNSAPLSEYPYRQPSLYQPKILKPAGNISFGILYSPQKSSHRMPALCLIFGTIHKPKSTENLMFSVLFNPLYLAAILNPVTHSQPDCKALRRPSRRCRLYNSGTLRCPPCRHLP